MNESQDRAEAFRRADKIYQTILWLAGIVSVMAMASTGYGLKQVSNLADRMQGLEINQARIKAVLPAEFPPLSFETKVEKIRENCEVANKDFERRISLLENRSYR